MDVYQVVIGNPIGKRIYWKTKIKKISKRGNISKKAWLLG